MALTYRRDSDTSYTVNHQQLQQHNSIEPENSISILLGLYRTENDENMGLSVIYQNGFIFITHIVPGSPAYRNGQVKVGDLLITVNKVNLAMKMPSLEDIYSAIEKKPFVELVVRSQCFEASSNFFVFSSFLKVKIWFFKIIIW